MASYPVSTRALAHCVQWKEQPQATNRNERDIPCLSPSLSPRAHLTALQRGILEPQLWALGLRAAWGDQVSTLPPSDNEYANIFK